MPTDNFGLYLKGGVSRVVVNSLESIALVKIVLLMEMKLY